MLCCHSDVGCPYFVDNTGLACWLYMKEISMCPVIGSGYRAFQFQTYTTILRGAVVRLLFRASPVFRDCFLTNAAEEIRCVFDDI